MEIRKILSKGGAAAVLRGLRGHFGGHGQRADAGFGLGSGRGADRAAGGAALQGGVGVPVAVSFGFGGVLLAAARAGLVNEGNGHFGDKQGHAQGRAQAQDEAQDRAVARAAVESAAPKVNSMASRRPETASAGVPSGPQSSTAA